MGHPKKTRKSYSTPSHPWQSQRIVEERVLVREYGLKNKKEIWKMDSLLKNFTSQAKQLIPEKSEQAEKEKKQLIDRLARIGLIPTNADLTSVLSLTLKDILERRLQTVIYKKGFAKTIKQARQFIIHEHIFVGDKKVTIPSYIVRSGEEAKIMFDQYSKFTEENHPARMVMQMNLEKKANMEKKA